MVQEFKNKMYIIQIVLETIKQGHAPRATLQLNVKYVCFKRRAGGHDPDLLFLTQSVLYTHVF